MTCGVRCAVSQLSPKAAADARAERKATPTAGARPPVDARFEISGTWDFKWPEGARIRIAFQLFPERMRPYFDAFSTVKEQVIQLARGWERALGGALYFDFDLPPLDAPLGSTAAAPDRHRSSFSKTTIQNCPYDVLVSLEDLPLTLEDPFRGPGDSQRTVALPISELGTYARRADYGAPTMYVGRFGRFAVDDSPSDFIRYFESNLAQHVIVHEFGHVLGLPHLHQHPRLVDTSTTPVTSPYPQSAQARRERIDAARASFYRPPAEVRQLLESTLGVRALDDTAVAAQLIQGWRGNEAYSDWVGPSREVQAAHTANGTLESVMTFPYYECMKAGHLPCSACSVDRSIADVLERPGGSFLTQPGPLDLEMLAQMYRPVVQAQSVDAAQ